MFSYLSILGKSVLIVALAAGLLTQFFPFCAFAICSFSKVGATPGLVCMAGMRNKVFVLQAIPG